MIFVAVGTQKFPLNRLLRELDMLLENGKIQEQVFAQSGCSDYVPQHFENVPFLPKDEFEKMVDQCDLLITHSGVGSILSGITHGKPVIVFPRLSKFGEHVDDHQLQIAESFSALNLVLMYREGDDLAELIDEGKKHIFSQYTSHRKNVIHTIQLFLNQMQEETGWELRH